MSFSPAISIDMRLKSLLIFRLTKMLTRLYCRMGMEMLVRGTHHVPQRGPAILVANHRSMADGPLLYSLMDRMAYSFIKTEYFRQPVLRWYMRGGGGIPVQSGAVRVSAVKEAHRVLKQGQLLLIFPEGRIHVGDGVGAFAPSFMKLAVAHGVPVIPISIAGTDRALPNGQWRWIPRPARIHVTVHDPVSFPGPALDECQNASAIEAVRQTIAQSWKRSEHEVRKGRSAPETSSLDTAAIPGERIQGGA